VLMQRVKRSWAVLCVLVALITFGGVRSSQAGGTATARAQKTFPGVTDYAVSDPRLIWHDADICPDTQAIDSEEIKRTAVHGLEWRPLYDDDNQRGDVCNLNRFYSKIITDDDYVYWVNRNGLVRLSVIANVGDPPEVLSAQVTGADNYHAELDQDDETIYAMSTSSTGATFWKVAKDDGNTGFISSLGVNPRDFSEHEDSFYYRISNALWRLREGPVTVRQISTGVTAYYPLGFRRGRFGSPDTDTVYVARGREIHAYDNLTEAMASSHYYRSTDTSALIYDIDADANYMFLLERRTTNITPQPLATYSHVLYRTRLPGLGLVDPPNGPIYSSIASLAGQIDANDVVVTGGFVYWLESGVVYSLPRTAETLVLTNMRITEVEVNQAIQSISGTVPLIRNRRTAVRVHVRSDGGAVGGVTARLFRLDGSGGTIGSGLVPLNDEGPYIVVRPDPDRKEIDDAFYFELPWNWINGQELRLRAELNPFHVPLEITYADNTWTTGTYSLLPSPRLAVRFFAIGYWLDGDLHFPRYTDDIIAAYSRIRRLYPLASTPGFIGDPSPGFRPSVDHVLLPELERYVDRTDESCRGSEDNRKGCVVNFVNSRLLAWRAESEESYRYFGLFYGGGAGGSGGRVPSIPSDVGAVQTGSAHPSGEEYHGGPSTTAHELAHAYGRYHPKGGQLLCTHEPSDQDYPYPDAFIGPQDGTFWGFNVGDPEFGQSPRVMPADKHRDDMTWCGDTWTSDYTYLALYDAFMGGSGGGGEVAGISEGEVTVGDWFGVFGVIDPSGASATIHYVRRRDEPVEHGSSPEPPDGYSIRLLSAEGGELADYPFPLSGDSADGEDEPLPFGRVVPFVDGTTLVQIVAIADDTVLASKTVSLNPPEINSVALVGTPEPVSGIAMLEWSAHDPDGDDLTFDILYGLTGQQSLEPVVFGATGSAAEIDTSRLAGGTGFFQLVATDGVLSATADTAPFAMAVKPPLPRILSPADGTSIQYGQLINLAGDAADAQDGSVKDGELVWRMGDEILGTGFTLSVTDLPVGENLISFEARNSDGESASTSISVFVGDDLALPGQTLGVTPEDLSWQVASPMSGQQTQELAISNVGDTRNFDWTAAENANWLQLSATSGQGETTISVFGDPSRVADSSSAEAEIVVTMLATFGVAVEQTITVPVTLFVGNQHESPVGDGLIRRGDCNSDGGVDLSDAIFGLHHLFTGGPVPDCAEACEVNSDAASDLSDSVYILSFLFLGGPAPESPFPGCAEDADPGGSLGCDARACR